MPRSVRLRLGVLGALLLAASCAQALGFAVNEGVTYWVSNDEIRARYAAIATDLSKLLRRTITVEPVGDCPALRKGLEAKAYDIALVHPAHVSIVATSSKRPVRATRTPCRYRASCAVSRSTTRPR